MRRYVHNGSFQVIGSLDNRQGSMCVLNPKKFGVLWICTPPERSTRANSGTNHLVFVHQVRVRSLFRFRLLIPSPESGFCTSDRRLIQNQSQVGCKSKPPWVCDPLPIYYHQIRLGLQLRECCEEWRDFPKRQQSRYIRKTNRAFSNHAIYHL